MNILEKIHNDENVLLNELHTDQYILTDKRIILKNPLSSSQKKKYYREISIFGEICEDYLLLNLMYLKETLLDLHKKPKYSFIYLEFEHILSNEKLDQLNRQILKNRKAKFEIGIGFRNLKELIRFLHEILQLKSDLIVIPLR